MDGTVFDGNYDFQLIYGGFYLSYFQNDQGFLVQPRQPFDFKLGARTVIQGWDKGAHWSSSWRSDPTSDSLETGLRRIGCRTAFHPGADLTFKVEVLALLLEDKQDDRCEVSISGQTSASTPGNWVSPMET